MGEEVCNCPCHLVNRKDADIQVRHGGCIDNFTSIRRALDFVKSVGAENVEKISWTEIPPFPTNEKFGYLFPHGDVMHHRLRFVIKPRWKLWSKSEEDTLCEFSRTYRRCQNPNTIFLVHQKMDDDSILEENETDSWDKNTWDKLYYSKLPATEGLLRKRLIVSVHSLEEFEQEYANKPRNLEYF